MPPGREQPQKPGCHRQPHRRCPLQLGEATRPPAAFSLLLWCRYPSQESRKVSILQHPACYSSTHSCPSPTHSSPTAPGPPSHAAGAARDADTQTWVSTARPVRSPALPHAAHGLPPSGAALGSGCSSSAPRLRSVCRNPRAAPQEGSRGQAGPMGATHCAPGPGPYPNCWLTLRSNIPPSQPRCAGPAPAALFAEAFAQGNIPTPPQLPGATCAPPTRFTAPTWAGPPLPLLQCPSGERAMDRSPL